MRAGYLFNRDFWGIKSVLQSLNGAPRLSNRTALKRVGVQAGGWGKPLSLPPFPSENESSPKNTNLDKEPLLDNMTIPAEY